MKNIHHILCCLFLMMLSHYQAQATHVQSINMSYQCIGNNQYEISVLLYRDCDGINAPTTQRITIEGLGACSSTSFTSTLSLVSTTVITPICSTPSGGNPCGTISGVYEEYFYQGVVTLPPTLSNCSWRASTSLCCRTTTITNLANPGNASLYTEVILVDPTVQCNNSPVTTRIPPVTVCGGTMVYLSNTANDPDGDSVAYRLATPLSAASTPLSFQAGLSVTNPFNTVNGVTLDPITGLLSFEAIGGQVANFDILIDEFRNGQLIGTSRITRHILILANCASASPVLDSVSRLVNGNWVTQGTSTTFDVCAGEPLSFQLHLSDADPADSLGLVDLLSTVMSTYPNANIQYFYTSNTQLTLQIDLPFAGVEDMTITISDNSCPLPRIQSYAINLVPRASCGQVWGYAIDDVNSNCSLDAGEDSLAQHLITFTRGAFSLTLNTNYAGYYNVPLDTGTYTITLSSTAHPYRNVCVGAQTVTVLPSTTTLRHDLPIENTALCTFMEVDIAANSLLRCFSNTYVVNYCNKGTITANMASIEVTLDSLFVVDSTSLPISSQNGFTYTFNVGNVAPLQCGSFFIYGRLDTACTSPLGRTFCASAYVHPDTTCGIWAGALLRVEGSCQNNSVGFRIKNVGQQAMSNPTMYQVIEDNIVLHQGTNISLAAGAATPWIYYPATGAHYRLAIDQEAGYPWGKEASAIVEGCLSSLFPNNPITTGLTNTFSLDDGAPYIAIDCQPSIGSYDPNDKQAFPVGYGGTHAIEPNVDLLYRIRFQNTGTAPAQDVVIVDTLSNFLDVTTLIPTTASHAYTWRLKEGHILEVTFANIQLPDSASSPLASQGFVDFKIKQQPNNPLGTVINNHAAIYFDRNAPIITNTVFHTIDENFLIFTQLPDLEQGDALSIKAFPNPFDQATTLQVESSQTYEVLHLQVYNSLGQLVGQATNQNGTQQIHFQRKNLETGIYFYRLVGDGAFLHAGQLMVR